MKPLHTKFKRKKPLILKPTGMFFIPFIDLEGLVNIDNCGRATLTEVFANMSDDLAEKELIRVFHFNMYQCFRKECQQHLQSKLMAFMDTFGKEIFSLSLPPISVNQSLVKDRFKDMYLAFNSLVMDPDTFEFSDQFTKGSLALLFDVLLEVSAEIPESKELRKKSKVAFKDHFYHLVIALEPIYRKKFGSKNLKGSDPYINFIRVNFLTDAEVSKVFRGDNSSLEIDDDHFKDTIRKFRESFDATEISMYTVI